MNRVNRAIVLATVAGLAVAAQTTSGSAIQWPWKKDKASEQLAPPPVEILPAPQDGTLLPPPGQAIVVQEAPLAPNDVMGRLDRAEARIRELTGQVEELAFRLRQTQDLLTAATGRRSDAVQTALAFELLHTAFLLHDDVIDGDTVRRGRPNVAGEFSADALFRGADSPRALLWGQSAAILAGDYVLAEASFRSFIVTFPSDQRLPDAQYWLGESLFARGQYREAADEFLSGYKAYPQSGKAADTLLKLGLSLAGLGEREAACSTYAEVLKKYPQSSNALRQRVQTEQTVSRCI